MIPSSFRRHHWSRASVLSASLLVTAQHLELCRKSSRMQVLYSFTLVEIEIPDFQIWLSRFCIAARVTAMRCEISGEFLVVEWIREIIN